MWYINTVTFLIAILPNRIMKYLQKPLVFDCKFCYDINNTKLLVLTMHISGRKIELLVIPYIFRSLFCPVKNITKVLR